MLKNICKRTLSTLLAIVMIVTTFCFADLGLFANAWVQVDKIKSSGRPNVKFYVPETIYKNPNGTGYQYFVDADSSGNLSTNPEKTTGSISFYSDSLFSSLTITRSDVSGSYTDSNKTLYTKTFSDGDADAGTVITWTANYVVDGKNYRSIAHTYVYAPFQGMIGSGFHAQRKYWYITHYA